MVPNAEATDVPWRDVSLGITANGVKLYCQNNRETSYGGLGAKATYNSINHA